MDWKAVGRQFAEFYYATFGANRQQLLNLYQADSLMTYEGQEFAGQQAIMEKLMVCRGHGRALRMDHGVRS